MKVRDLMLFGVLVSAGTGFSWVPPAAASYGPTAISQQGGGAPSDDADGKKDKKKKKGDKKDGKDGGDKKE